MARYRDDGEVQIDNSTNGHFRIAFQWLIVIAAFNVGTLLMSDKIEARGILRLTNIGGPKRRWYRRSKSRMVLA
jgi:hypothetical protein